MPKDFVGPIGVLGSSERKAQCSRILTKIVQIIEDEAARAGWQREEILVGLCDAADNRLEALMTPEGD